MKQLKNLDKYTTPSEWKESVIMNSEKKKDKVYLKRRSFTAIACVMALVAVGGAGVYFTNNNPLSTTGDSSQIETADILYDDSKFTVIEVTRDSLLLYNKVGFVSIPFADNDKLAEAVADQNVCFGDIVNLDFDGTMLETYPLQITSCTGLEVVSNYIVNGLEISDILGVSSITGEITAINDSVLDVTVGEEVYKVSLSELGYVFDSEIVPNQYESSKLNFDDLQVGDIVKVPSTTGVSASGDVNTADFIFKIHKPTPTEFYGVRKISGDEIAKILRETGEYEVSCGNGGVWVSYSFIPSKDGKSIYVKVVYINGLGDQYVSAPVYEYDNNKTGLGGKVEERFNYVNLAPLQEYVAYDEQIEIADIASGDYLIFMGQTVPESTKKLEGIYVGFTVNDDLTIAETTGTLDFDTNDYEFGIEHYSDDSSLGFLSFAGSYNDEKAEFINALKEITQNCDVIDNPRFNDYADTRRNVTAGSETEQVLSVRMYKDEKTIRIQNKFYSVDEDTYNNLGSVLDKIRYENEFEDNDEIQVDYNFDFDVKDYYFGVSHYNYKNDNAYSCGNGFPEGDKNDEKAKLVEVVKSVTENCDVIDNPEYTDEDTEFGVSVYNTKYQVMDVTVYNDEKAVLINGKVYSINDSYFKKLSEAFLAFGIDEEKNEESSPEHKLVDMLYSIKTNQSTVDGSDLDGFDKTNPSNTVRVYFFFSENQVVVKLYRDVNAVSIDGNLYQLSTEDFLKVQEYTEGTLEND